MKRKETITNLLISTKRQGIESVIKLLDNSDFHTAPASKTYHSNYDGGLAEHSYLVYRALDKLVVSFSRQFPKDSIIICGLLHDLCKINFYKKVKKWVKDDNNKWQSKDGYNIEDSLPLGHGSKSIIMLQEHIKLTDLEKYSIMYHMGIPESFELKQSFNSALNLYPEAILLHLADFLSSRLFEKIQE